MRSLGTLTDAGQAEGFADYLQSLGIEAHVQPSPAGHAVWVCDEDKLARARQEYQAFLQNPDDARYRRAAPPSSLTEEEPPSRTVPSEPDVMPDGRGGSMISGRPLTIGLIMACIVVTLLLYAPDTKKDVYHELFITEIRDIGGGWIEWTIGLPELKKGEFWRTITPAFIHLSEAHLLVNMLALFYLGGMIEQRAGPLRLALLFLFFAVPSNLCQYWFSEVHFNGLIPVSVDSRPAFGGASGVLFGFFGYIWMKAVFHSDGGYEMPASSVLFSFVWLILCMTGVLGPIANTAHVVGLIIGMMTGYVSAWWYGFAGRAS